MDAPIRDPERPSVKVEAGASALEVAATLAPHGQAEVLALEVDGEVVDLERRVPCGGTARALTFDDPLGRYTFWHSSAHIMAQAVSRLFPEVRLAIGPPIAEGFYYDMELPRPLTEEDFPAIEAEMRRIVAEDLPIVREEWTRQAALEHFARQNQPYKVEIIQDLPPDAAITCYRQGEFLDLCRGPHLRSTGYVKAPKLLSLAGAYWRGDERRPMLQRLYGTSFPTEAALTAHLALLEEARRRDHRKLGKELDLFTFEPEAAGFVFWLPKGMVVYRTLEEYSRQLQLSHGYVEVSTPWVYDVSLWKRSGHFDHYKDNMFFIPREDEQLGLKPMNCPGAALAFGSRVRSYRELPLRLMEYGALSRYERSGTMHGLFRVRGFVQDDAHIFLPEEDIAAEVGRILDLVDEVYRPFGMSYRIHLSTRPDDAMGEPELWERAETALAEALAAHGRPYDLKPKDGAFYGPKLDFDLFDSLHRPWQCATIQLDFQLPRTFDLTFRGRDGQEHRPVVLHRAILGSLERFIGILTEHYAGAFPPWLAPVQVRVLPIAERHGDFAREVLERLVAAGIRAELDASDEKFGQKIRRAQLEKVPYMAVVGDREVESRTVSVRTRLEKDAGSRDLDAFVAEVADVIARRLASPAVAVDHA